MSIRQTILDWSERGVITDVRAALEAGGALPQAQDWRRFLDRLLLWSGAVALAAAVVFFIAHNWSELGKLAKFALVELLLAGTVIGYWRLGPERATGKASLLAACILLGALLALFGQTYQTGADTWELFSTWAALMAPWVLLGRFAGLWMLWLAVANVAIVFYFRVFPGVFGLLFATQALFWVLFAFNTLALVAWELAARRFSWLDERWAPRLVAVASGAAITFLVLHAIFEWNRASGLVLPAYVLWLTGAYAAYRVWTLDLLVLALGCLSLIVAVTAFLSKNLLHGRGEAGAFLLIGLAVIGMAAAAAWWLKEAAKAKGARA